MAYWIHYRASKKFRTVLHYALNQNISRRFKKTLSLSEDCPQRTKTYYCQITPSQKDVLIICLTNPPKVLYSETRSRTEVEIMNRDELAQWWNHITQAVKTKLTKQQKHLSRFD